MSATIQLTSTQGARLDLDVADLLTDADRERVHDETRRWIKSLRLATDGGRTFRERFSYRDTSLWWFTEVYLHKSRRLERAVSTVLALDRAREQHAPSAIEITSDDPAIALAALAFGDARRVPVGLAAPRSRLLDRRWESYRIGLTARLSRLRPARRATPAAHARVAAFIHTAFWRHTGSGNPGDEAYIGPILDELAARLGPSGLTYVGVGPRRNFRARRWWDPVVAGSPGGVVVPIERLAPWRTLSRSLDLWRHRYRLAEEATSGEAIRAAGQYDGCDLWPLLQQELRNVALLQWPWSARAMDEAGAALDTLSPEVVVTYAEAGGWGRALVIEARRRRVPSVGVQHGFIYRHWLNYRHEEDEMMPAGGDPGFPYPERTLVFDGYARRHLTELGRLPEASIRVTGSPRLDMLVSRFRELSADRGAIREALGVKEGEALVVLAAKLTEITRDLPELFDAASSLAGVRLVVKTHPAETPDGYLNVKGSRDAITVAASDADLGRLLVAADLVVTRNSTVAVDALVLGVPALVIGLPSNLSPFVEAGVMFGAVAGGIRGALDAVLYDRRVRETLVERAGRFTAREGLSGDGGSAVRAADEILSVR
jgi:hypothetical protein